MKHSDSLPKSNTIYFRPDRPMLQVVQKIVSTLADAAFLAFVALVLCTPAWRTGPFTWWSVWQSPVPYEQPAQIGLLSLLPLLCVPAWGGAWIAQRHGTKFLAHLLGRCVPRRQRISIAGPLSRCVTNMAPPLLALSLLILIGLDPALNQRTVVQVTGLGLFWFSYLYVLYRRPPLTFPLLLVVFVQGGVAVAQFGLQRDLGLAFLGELPLDPQLLGTSVLWSSEGVWLRGYGLTAHPNVLGAMLAVLLLVLLPQLRRRRGWQQALLGAGVAVGSLGLLVSFSRTGWLAFIGGLMYWAFAGYDAHLSSRCAKNDAHLLDRCAKNDTIVQSLRNWYGRVRQDWRPFWTQRALWLPFLLVPFFLLFYHDLILSRWIHLDTAIEARSIQERLRDAHVALALIGAHPWQGVGAGNGLDAAQAVHPDAGAVHSVSLLVTAELGIIAGICWLLFMLLPLLPLGTVARRDIDSAVPWQRMRGRYNRFQQYRPAWAGLLIAGLFDTPLWLTTSWRAALLLGVLAALQSWHISRTDAQWSAASSSRCAADKVQTIDGRKEDA